MKKVSLKVKCIKSAVLLALFGSTLGSVAYADNPGWQFNVLSGVSVLNTNFGNEYATNPIITNYNTLSGSTDSAEYTPALGVAYAFDTSPYTYLGNYYILQDIALGVNGYFTGVADRNGNVNNGSTTVATYSANFTNWRVMLDAEFDIHPFWQRIMPFAEVGIGDSINVAKYNETAVNSGYNTTNFSSTKNNFAYEVGGGVKVPLNAHSQLSFRYLYSDLGDVSGGTSYPTTIFGTTTTTYTSLNTHMHVSSFLLGYTYTL